MKSEIQKFFKGEVEDSDETLTKYSHDASLLELRPKVVLFPMDSEDVKNLVKWVSENSARQDLAEKYGKLSITARCAGTDMSGGAIGESIILDFSRHMNKLIGGPLPSDDGKSWYITVQPGMFYRDFEKITLSKGLILPCYTASKSLNAMGGMYGNNSAGERTLKYGKTEDYILSAKVVFCDGNEYLVKPVPDMYRKVYDLIKDNEDEIKNAKPNVHKNSAGYYIWNVICDNPQIIPSGVEGSNKVFDLNKLLVGSQGTLGIATEITFKIIPENKYSKLVVIFMKKDMAPLGRLVDEILTQNPETLETYDDKTMKLAVKFFPEFLKNKGFFGMIKFMWSFLPEFWMLVTGGFPKLIILAEFAGDTEDIVNKKCEALVQKIKDFKLKMHITKSETEAEKYWDIRRDSFALLRKHVKGMHTAPFVDDIIVRPEFLPKFLPELNAIMDQYPSMISTLAGHAGDGNFHVIPLMDFSKPDIAKTILECGEKVYDLVMKYHGSITAEHNDGLIRTPYLEKMYGDKVVALFAKIKNIFDPLNILNPGKKVPTPKDGGTKEFIAEHISLEHHSTHGS